MPRIEERRKPLTMKDTKVHEGLHCPGVSSCDFVTFVVLILLSLKLSNPLQLCIFRYHIRI